jgi:hypothetical protein
MTVDQFKFIITNGQVLDSETRQVNMLYTGSRIQAIAVRIENNNLSQLQQATTIIVKAPQVGSILNISLENSQVPIRTVNREIVGQYYLYTIIEEDQQPVMEVVPSPSGTPSVENYYTDVIILPQEDQQGFETGEYNVLVNNVITNRPSTYLQISDRQYSTGSSTNPGNLPDILLDNAMVATVQDSNYSTTGWINGRYEGTQTSEITYGNIQPALTGGSFKGTFYAATTPDTAIFNASERSYTDYYVAGGTQLPSYTEINPLVEMNNNILGGDTLFILQGSTSLVGRKFIVEQGSLLKIKQDPSETPTSEIVKVLSIEPSGSSAFTRKFSVTVQRGWNQTTEFSYSDGDDVLVIDPQTIFKLEGSKVYQERQGKIYVQETQEIVHLDSLGQIISSSVNITV